jgi:microcystin-dependent protein
MPLFQYLNNVIMTLAIPLDFGDTQLVVLNEDLDNASKFDPAKQLSLTLVGDQEYGNYEIVYATARTGTTFEVLRGQEDTVAVEWPAGTRVLAAFTAGILQGIGSVPTTADQVAYEGGNFGQSGTVEETLDDMGDAIIRINATTEYYENVRQRVGGGLYSGGTDISNDLRWQGTAKRFATNGLGAALVTTATIEPPVIPPDVGIAVRTSDLSKYGTFKVRAYNNALPANYVEWTVPSSSWILNTWSHIYLSYRTGTKGGDPATNVPDRISLTVNDSATGVFTFDLNFVDVAEERTSYIGTFLLIRSEADWNKVWAIQKYGYQVSVVILIEDIESGAVLGPSINLAEKDGNRIYLSSTANFKAQTQEQILVKLFTGTRLAAEIGIRAAGFVYPGHYNGPLDLDPTVSIRELVLQAYPRGVGPLTSRGNAELYRFDDPLISVANLAAAQALLTDGDNRSINIDISLLSAADLSTLYAQVADEGYWYITQFPYQNADNIKSGTVHPDRLPVVPIAKGGTGGITPAEARENLGIEYDVDVVTPTSPWICPVGTVLDYLGTAIPTGWLKCDGSVQVRATYPKLYAVMGTRFNTGGETSAQFRLPDLRGRVAAGVDDGSGRLTGYTTPGTAGGLQAVTLTEGQLPAHFHDAGTLVTDTEANHQHGTIASNTGAQYAPYGTKALTAAGPGAEGGASEGNKVVLSEFAGGHNHDVSGNTGSKGSGQSHANVQPTMAVFKIVRAA